MLLWWQRILYIEIYVQRDYEPMFSRKNSDEKKPGDKPPKDLLGTSLEENIKRVLDDFGHSGDLIVNEISLSSGREPDCASLYIKGLADGNILNDMSMELIKLRNDSGKMKAEKAFYCLKSQFSAFRSSKDSNEYTGLCDELLSGNTIFLVDSYARFFSIETNSNKSRSITEPTSQTIIKGPKDAFTENIFTNVYLIRCKIRNKDLRVESLNVGSVTHTRIKLVYIKDIAKQNVVDDMRSRLSKMNNDSVLDSGYIEEFVKTSRYSLFPTSMNSERPDAVAAAILEGRVAILVDGTPYVLTAPALFIEFIQSSEDYYNNYFISSLMRIIRYIALLLTLLVPGIYVALTSFHQEIVPTPLLISIAAQREGTPFPVFLEVLLMELTFEILREAGIRMPRAIGPAVSIVGALVLGQAAVEAGLISAAVVIVVSVTAISSFAITNYGMSNAIRLIRFIILLAGSILGLYGISISLIVLVLHLCSLKTATVPYLSPVAPRVKGGNKDSIIRFPIWKMIYRPAGISADSKPRTDPNSPVEPSKKGKQEFA
jgi:spore germination protein KA